MTFVCEQCFKEFSTRQSKHRHVKNNICKNKKLDTRLSELEDKISTMSSLEQSSSIVISSKPLEISSSPNLVSDNTSSENGLKNITINYVLPKQNYWEMLKDKMGTADALRFLYKCADLKLGGDILMFEELFLPQDNKASWPVARKGTSKELILKEPDGTVIDKCAGRVIYDRFVVNYKDALLEGSNQILSILVEPEKIERELTKEKIKIEIRGKVKDIHPDDLEKAYTSIFTEYDFGKFQTRAYEVQHNHPKPHSQFSAGMIESNFK